MNERIEVGDIVEKSKGHAEFGQSGIVVSRVTNSLGNTLLTVLTPVGTSVWYLPLVTKLSDV